MNPPGGWDVFAPYGGLHALALIVCLLLIAVPSLLGRALSKNSDNNGDKNGEMDLRRILAALALLYWVVYNIWWNWHGLDPRTGLPLHICDLNGLIAPFALLSRQRWARATLYFWTAALTAQAFIQPALSAGPASLVFWAFWVGHTFIAACAVYDIAVLGFRPSWGDFGRALAASAIYIALVAPLDVWLNANYGFVGNPADINEVPPFIAALGPWPQRAIILVALAPLGFFVVLLPWLFVARGGASEEKSTAPGLR
jgi:hypothetical integral membrane protein (TIGR02206 family)